MVQSDPFNNSRLRTILVVILTSNMGRADSPGNVVISKSASGLSKDSVANVTQIIAADKGILTEKVGKISHRKLQQIQQGIKLVLGLNS